MNPWTLAHKLNRNRIYHCIRSNNHDRILMLALTEYAHRSNINIRLAQCLTNKRNRTRSILMEHNERKLISCNGHIISIYFGNHNLTTTERATNNSHMTIMVIIHIKTHHIRMAYI